MTATSSERWDGRNCSSRCWGVIQREERTSAEWVGEWKYMMKGLEMQHNLNISFVQFDVYWTWRYSVTEEEYCACWYSHRWLLTIWFMIMGLWVRLQGVGKSQDDLLLLWPRHLVNLQFCIVLSIQYVHRPHFYLYSYIILPTRTVNKHQAEG